MTQYFLALVPPSPVFEETLTQKEYFRDHYQSKASLNSPPHITLHMPFRWKAEKETMLVKKLEDFANDNHPFTVELNNYDCFAPRVIFVNVVQSPELDNLYQALKRFCKRELNLFNADYKELPFHPHLTLAFRDLKKSVFDLAWQDFSHREYRRTFMADHFTLLKHNGKIWEKFRDFRLPGASVPTAR